MCPIYKAGENLNLGFSYNSFAKKIINQAPQYRHIYKVRPGLTSWGMVRYGYASSVEEMIHRMKFDLIYIENMSIFNDMKVLLYTIWTVLLGRGK